MGRKPKPTTHNQQPRPKDDQPVAGKTSIKPLSGFVLIEPAEAETKTTSGIILPENAQEKPSLGKVLSVGQDIILDSGKTIKSPVEIGDKVYFKKWGSDDIKVNGQELKLVKFDDLMAIVE